jgi:uncharacterized protein DUF955
MRCDSKILGRLGNEPTHRGKKADGVWRPNFQFSWRDEDVIANNDGKYLEGWASVDAFNFAEHLNENGVPDFALAQCGNFREIEKVARKLRVEFGYRNEVKVDILDVVEFKLSTLFPDFSFVVIEDKSEADDVLALTRAEPLEIVLKESIYQQAINEHPQARFILAHELGHLMLHRKYIHPMADILLDDIRSPDSGFEGEADWFAGAFLIPSEVINCMAPKDIATRFGVSESLAQERLRQLNVSD